MGFPGGVEVAKFTRAVVNAMRFSPVASLVGGPAQRPAAFDAEVVGRVAQLAALQRKADALGDANQCDAAQHVAPIATLVAGIAHAVDCCA